MVSWSSNVILGPAQGPDSCAIGADLGPVAAHLGSVEAKGYDRVCPLRLSLLDHPLYDLLPAGDEVLGHPLQLATDQRLQPGPDLGADIPGPDGEPEHFPEYLCDLVTRNVIHGADCLASDFVQQDPRIFRPHLRGLLVF